MRAIVTPDGVFTFRGETVRAALGYGGVRADKREGDGATPLGVLPLRRVLYRPDRGPPPSCAVPRNPVTRTDGWCDDPAHPDYNRLVRLPIGAHAEALWHDDGTYDIIGVLGWNDRPVYPRRGSAIFLHLARHDYAPTQGCVALASDDLRRVLALGLTEIVVKA
ncbi:L,D-transpeptidase family protein [Rhodopila sp.]|uniref:L,D-transpeptidase family protein n=1 Tax=Rhodopila sp. TaxID=2480087 RepID=UPI003D0BA6FA